MIIKVNSFGPKIAMAILSHLPQEEFIRAIMEKDEKALCSVSGVGKKGASRLVLEMRDSLKLNFSTEDFGSDDVKEVKMQASLALLALGYKNTEVDELINKATKDKKIFSVEELIQQSLKLGS
jgi:Holliday junction DNA helicase RuvA